MIGIFDSGVGGLSIAKELFIKLPQYQIIYFGDTARFPYGSKSQNLIRQYSKEITEFLLKNGAKIIIIACHTSSATSSDFLKNQFKNWPFFSMTEIQYGDIINDKNKRIGVIGTQATIDNHVYEKKLIKQNKNLKVYSKACPLFAPIVEEGLVSKEEINLITKRYLEDLKAKKVGSLILGCTHYPALKNFIQDFMGKEVKIIDPAKNLIQSLEIFLTENPGIEQKIKRGAKHKFFISDNSRNFNKMSKFFLGKEIKVKTINLTNNG